MSKDEYLITDAPLKALTVFAMPMILGSFFQQVYNMADSIIVGQFVGSSALAAVGACAALTNVFICIALGAGVGAGVLVSRYFGAREYSKMKTIVSTSLISFLILSVLLGIFGFCFSHSMMSMLQTPVDILDEAVLYLRVYFVGFPFLFMYNILSTMFTSIGESRIPLGLLIFSSVLNIIMDLWMVAGLGLGVFGAALATLIAKIPCAVIALIVLTRPEQLIRINFRGFKFDKSKMGSIVKIGLPTAIGGSTMQLGFLLMTKNVNAYGPTATTAYGIGNKINSIITMPASGIGSAISTIVGQNMGAGNIKRTDKSYHIALRIGAVFLFICGMILSRRFIAEPMVRFFTSDEQVVPLATQFLSIMAICCWTNAFYNVTQGLFQGCGHTMITMAVDATRIWIFRFLTLWVCANVLGMGVESVWYAVVVSNATSALILYILYWTGIWKKSTIKIEKTQDEGNNSDEKVKSLNEADSDIKVSSNIQTVN